MDTKVQRRLMAQMRSADWIQKCLLFGVDRTYRGHHETDANDPERTSGLEIGFSQILAGHSFANEQPAKAKKPRKVAAGQEMLLPISGKRTTKQVVKKANKRAAARSRKWA